MTRPLALRCVQGVVQDADLGGRGWRGGLPFGTRQR
jgi:hypothetical protein